MFSNLISFDSHINGVEVVFAADGAVMYNYATIKKEKGKVELVQSALSIDGSDELFKHLDKKHPVILSCKGRGIAHKKISASSDQTYESLLNVVLPNSNVVDFYVQTFDTADNQKIVSVARKEPINELLDSFNKSGYNVIGCHLGPISIQSVIPLLFSQEQNSGELFFAGNEILVREGLLTTFSSKPSDSTSKTISVGALQVPEQLLVAFSSALSYLNPEVELESNFDRTHENLDEFKNELKFKKTGVVVLAVAFTLLLLNFIAFSYYSDQVNEKTTRIAASSTELGLIDTMQSQIQEKTLFLSKSGLSEPSRTSYYADNIAKDVPAEIKLTSITIHPLIKNEDELKLEFEAKRIMITGKSQHSIDVNEWNKTIRREKWLKAISILTYKQKESDKPGEFVIEIKLN